MNSVIFFQMILNQSRFKAMFGETWGWAGEFRKMEVNIGRVSPYQVSSEIKKICDDINFLPITSALLPWSACPLNKNDDARKKYLMALKEADQEKFNKLVRFAKSEFKEKSRV